MDQQEITIKRAPWSQEAAAALRHALPFADVSELEDQVEAGAVLFAVEYGGAVVAWYVLRVEVSPETTEGVIVAAAGDLPGVDLCASVIPYIEKQFYGCRSLRFHTARPGLVKKMARLGYTAGEIVMRKTL